MFLQFYAHSFFRLSHNHWERDLHQYLPPLGRRNLFRSSQPIRTCTSELTRGQHAAANMALMVRVMSRYYFFQLLTVTGAMLLIASRGAGRFSIDHNKKFG